MFDMWNGAVVSRLELIKHLMLGQTIDQSKPIDQRCQLSPVACQAIQQQHMNDNNECSSKQK